MAHVTSIREEVAATPAEGEVVAGADAAKEPEVMKKGKTDEAAATKDAAKK